MNVSGWASLLNEGLAPGLLIVVLVCLGVIRLAGRIIAYAMTGVLAGPKSGGQGQGAGNGEGDTQKEAWRELRRFWRDFNQLQAEHDEARTLVAAYYEQASILLSQRKRLEQQVRDQGLEPCTARDEPVDLKMPTGPGGEP